MYYNIILTFANIPPDIVLKICNTDIRTVSARLGHAQTSTTMNIYAYSFKKLDEVASDTLADMLKLK